MAASKNGTRKSAKKKTATKAARRRARPAAAAAEIPSPDQVLGPIGATLTEKQLRFAHLVAANPNATEAYARAFGNESRAAASVEGSKLLKMPAVAELVSALRQELLARFNVTNERIVEEYARIAFLDPADFYDDHGKLLPVLQMPEHARRAIAALDVDDRFEERFEGTAKTRIQVGTTTKLRLSPKREALQDLAKIRKMLSDKIEHSMSESLEALLARSWSPDGGAHA